MVFYYLNRAMRRIGVGDPSHSRYHSGGLCSRRETRNPEATMPLRKNYKDSRILVTGGAGFIGSHLCERLVAEGAEGISADNYFTGSRKSIAHLLTNPMFEAMRHDVTFPLYIEVDAIFNLACPASPIHYQRDPVQTTKTRVPGAINMLGLAKQLRARIFQA